MPLRLWAVVIVLCAVSPAAIPHLSWEPQHSGVTARLRGLSAVSERVAWASGASGTVLRTIDGGQTWQPRPVAGGATLDFRDIDAVSDRVAYVLSIGPGESSRIYKTSDGGEHWDLQFANTEPRVFLDAMAFWDADRGIAVSDSVDEAFVILATANGGRTWARMPAGGLPRARPGEGAFAASGTNVAVSGRDAVWIATGASRVLHSADGGRSWTVAVTPLPSGESAGIFSIAFRDPRHGVVVGGNYREEASAASNAALTSDGSLTWQPPSAGLGGYRSVVARVPSVTAAYVAAGPSGVDWSSDDGRTWTPMAIRGADTVSFAPGTHVGWGAGDRGWIAKLLIQD